MFYIIEFQTRPDGVVNTSVTGRSTFASGLSYYHSRYAQAVMSEQFVSVSLMLVDADLTVQEQSGAIVTQYKPAED